jgi:hypothetical protein
MRGHLIDHLPVTRGDFNAYRDWRQNRDWRQFTDLAQKKALAALIRRGFRAWLARKLLGVTGLGLDLW